MSQWLRISPCWTVIIFNLSPSHSGRRRRYVYPMGAVVLDFIIWPTLELPVRLWVSIGDGQDGWAGHTIVAMAIDAILSVPCLSSANNTSVIEFLPTSCANEINNSILPRGDLFTYLLIYILDRQRRQSFSHYRGVSVSPISFCRWLPRSWVWRIEGPRRLRRCWVGGRHDFITWR